MDSYCLLDLQQHHLAAQLYCAWDSKMGLKAGLSPNDIIYPLDGQEVLVGDNDVLIYLVRLVFRDDAKVLHGIEGPPGMYVGVSMPERGVYQVYC